MQENPHLKTDYEMGLDHKDSKLKVHFKQEDPIRIGNTLSLQDDFDKIEKLSMINANARYELINAN